MSAIFAASLALGTAFAAPAQANVCKFPCFDGASESSGGSGVSGGSGAVAVAHSYLGTNPTRRSRLWCAEFMNMVEKKLGRPGTGSAMARSFASYGRRVSDPRPGDIAVMRRKGGGHVGYVMSVDGGKVKLISGNHGRKVGIGTYSRSRVVAFVRP
jgi:uncharacterized protein (TIGR02594 family)